MGQATWGTSQMTQSASASWSWHDQQQVHVQQRVVCNAASKAMHLVFGWRTCAPASPPRCPQPECGTSKRGTAQPQPEVVRANRQHPSAKEHMVIAGNISNVPRLACKVSSAEQALTQHFLLKGLALGGLLLSRRSLVAAPGCCSSAASAMLSVAPRAPPRTQQQPQPAAAALPCWSKPRHRARRVLLRPHEPKWMLRWLGRRRQGPRRQLRPVAGA